SVKNPKKSLNTLVQKLIDLEKFYDVKGGIVGYELIIMKLLNEKEQCAHHDDVVYEMPAGLDISHSSKELDDSIRWGIESMRLMGEMYPLGGAADRLNLQDDETGEPLPAAQLRFCGRTLLETLIRDLQGREFLYFKLFDKQLVTPIAMMTSHEKNNHFRIIELCESNEWFGRPQDSFRFFIQPLVPVVTTEGEWAVQAPMSPILKPGGHGVIWKAALDAGIFDWFDELQKKKLLIRQINNPIAGVDTGLLAFTGIGCQKDKDFGFASCNRMIASSEGMDVLKEVKQADGYEYCITNIEYTEFIKHGIADAPDHQGSPYSRFPANTNILFGDLAAIRQALSVCSIPGMLINLKNKSVCYSKAGPVEKLAGRLESTMQNIADFMVDKSPKKLLKKEIDGLRTFLTYNERRKTISVTKQSFVSGKSLTDTPEGCFYDLTKNYRDLLINYCRMNLPLEQDEKDYLSSGPDCVVLFHPSLGMLYSVIGQKIRGGKLAKGAELVLEISEAHIVDLDLEGSLLIEAEAIMGRADGESLLKFDANQCGKCTLVNVKVKNQGMEPTGKNAWQCQYNRKEALRITLHGNAEFFAENVRLEGDVHFDVPDGHRLVVYQQGSEIAWHFEKIPGASWKWEYSFDDDARIVLEKLKL
ncbi:MAG TPA: hypothetical protein VGP47_05405, partial [Parachlamydiaceae bacterium]|nr:hypothetical protein [Parachlamydiaceae bacterium]